MTGEHPLATFTDADLKATLTRAMRTVLMLGVVLVVAFWLAAGWQSGALAAVGTVISAGSLFEWKRLILIINARLDNQKTPRSTGFVVAMFFLRLLVAVGVLYGSLKCFHGSVYAILAGLGLAVAALTIEAVRILRG